MSLSLRRVGGGGGANRANTLDDTRTAQYTKTRVCPGVSASSGVLVFSIRPIRAIRRKTNKPLATCAALGARCSAHPAFSGTSDPPRPASRIRGQSVGFIGIGLHVSDLPTYLPTPWGGCGCR